MSELGWREAIIEVLKSSDGAMHYADIASAIAERKLRSHFGATPDSTVNANITDSLKNETDKTPFVRVDRGYYWLKEKLDQGLPAKLAQQAVLQEAGLINAFGMYWSRNAIAWKSKPKILGRQQQNSSAVDFTQQTGVYLLYDGRQVIYVGRAIEQPLGVRLQQHTVDRLNGRWDRFSWFGIYPVADNGELEIDKEQTFDAPMLIATMEALLIEGLEPPQNRKGGDRFRAAEFIQVVDPELEKLKMKNLIDEWKNKL
jgi:hypothetical protein